MRDRTGANNPNWRGGDVAKIWRGSVVARTCGWCRRTFFAARHRAATAQYCSRHCAARARGAAVPRG